MPKGTLIRAPFGLGEDNASDPLTLPPGKLAQATNVAFDTKGALIKKPGAFQLGANDQAGNPVANQGALVTFRGELGRIIDSGAFYGYQQGGAFWQDRNSPAPAFVAERQAVLKTLPSGYAFGQVASTVVGGYMLMATQQAEFVGNIITLYSIDLVSGRATQLLSTGGSAPCVVSGGGSFAFLVYINELAGDVGDIKYVAFNSATGKIGSSTSLGISMVSGYLATQLDACMTSATELAVAWEAASSGTPYQANLFAWGGSSFTTGTNTSMTLAIGASLRMSFLPTNGYLAITTAVSLISGDTGTPAIKYEVLTSSLGAVVGGHSSNLPAISSGQPPNFQGLRAEPIEVYGDGANHFEIIVEATFNFDMTGAGNTQSYPGGFAMWPNYLLKFKTDYTAGQGSTSWTKLHQGLGLASTPIGDSTTGQNIMLACSGSALQPTLYLINDSGRVLSNIAQGTGGGYQMAIPAPNSAGACLATPNPRLVYDPNIAFGYRVCALTQANLEAQNGTLISQLGIDLLTFTAQIGPGLDAGDGLYLTGGVVSRYDGRQIQEHNFFQMPEGVVTALSKNTAVTGLAANSVYQYAVTYRCIDNLGNVDESGYFLIPINTGGPQGTLLGVGDGSTTVFTFTATPHPIATSSIVITSGFSEFVDDGSGGISGPGLASGSVTYSTGAISITFSTAPALGQQILLSYSISGGNQVALTIPPPRITNRAVSITAEIYRSQANGTTLDRVTTFANAPAWQISQGTYQAPITFTDNLIDTVLDGNDEIYTTGNVAQHACPPAATVACTHQGRVILAGVDDAPTTVWYSTIGNANTLHDFSSFFVIELPDLNDPITALASMDDYLVIFRARSTYVVSGAGPDATGNGPQYSSPQKIPGNHGCPGGVAVPYSNGVACVGQDGIWTLGRGLDWSYTGEDEQENVQGQSVTAFVGGMVAPGYRQIRFWGEAYGGATLVYDYQRGQWSRWTSMNAVSAVDWNGAFTYLSQSATGGVWTELGLGSSSFVDENGNIGALIQTGWISQTGPLGWGRVYNLWLSGAWVTGQSALTITTQYDEDPSYSDTQTITPATETATPAGETSPPRLLRIDLKRQRFSSVRFQIAEVAASAVPMTLNGFVLQVQPLAGPKRIGPQGNYAG